MAYVRIDDSADDHPKVLQLTDSQFRLWVRGLCYCQKHLTDGFVPTVFVERIRRYRTDSQRLCEVGLLEQCQGGYQFHDYLEWNDSKDLTSARKKKAKDRKQAWLDRQQPTASQNGYQERVRNASIERVPNASLSTPHLTSPQILEEQREGAAPRLSGTTDADIAHKAGLFFDVWSRLFSEHRFGATYHGRPHVDYAKCCNLVSKFQSERLAKLAVVFLNSNEPFIEQSNRSLAVFESRISWCDEQLRKAEAQWRSA